MRGCSFPISRLSSSLQPCQLGEFHERVPRNPQGLNPERLDMLPPRDEREQVADGRSGCKSVVSVRRADLGELGACLRDIISSRLNMIPYNCERIV